MTDGNILDPDAAGVYLEDWQRRIEQKAAETRAMSDRLAALRVTTKDDNGLTEVTIDANGALLDVRFTDRIQRVAPDALARAVMGAVTDARRRAADQSRRIVTETMGEQSVAAHAIAERVEHQLRGE
ncbi:YbaB/EbfC family nucleoid-associated protein [Actinoplanes sp. TBRC 11911]|uniref:YbaB/EbfC family nucleoid-associated protein n=1 Tax=Actinoplanes sp. TBRC 11911 TaxID=2729386 RepID=UPI00145EACEB|nr:YbaB/EbfC family nucleoid-associated protein [Actinoplanes sp. TBRC 11911]NMO50987.1 YbaB/EbfC family nucleoid-associated protein [Actinoplanes sp. TBRC 11911]